MAISNRLNVDSQKRLKKSHISAAVLLSALLVLSGCSGKGKSDDEDKASTATSFTTTTFITTTVPESTTTTTQVIYPEEYRVPDVIDAAYIKRVVDRLYLAQAEVDKSLVAGEPFGKKHENILKNIYVDNGKEEFLDNGYLPVKKTYTQEFNPDYLRKDITSLKTNVVEVVKATPSCIWFKKTIDNSGVAKEPFETSVYTTFLVRRDNHDLNINPTPWKVYLSLTDNNVEGRNPCK